MVFGLVWFCFAFFYWCVDHCVMHVEKYLQIHVKNVFLRELSVCHIENSVISVNGYCRWETKDSEELHFLSSVSQVVSMEFTCKPETVGLQTSHYHFTCLVSVLEKHRITPGDYKRVFLLNNLYPHFKSCNIHT